MHDYSNITVTFQDTIYYDEADYSEAKFYYPGIWNYERLWVEDHYALTIYKLSRLLNMVTQLQVTSPDLDGKESEIPIPFDRVADLQSTSDHLMVMITRFLLYS